jgi:hypothetical protein
LQVGPEFGGSLICPSLGRWNVDRNFFGKLVKKLAARILISRRLYPSTKYGISVSGYLTIVGFAADRTGGLSTDANPVFLTTF